MKIFIEGREFLSPDRYLVGFERVGEFVRNANGNLVGDLVAVKAQVSCGWKVMSGEEYGRLSRAGALVFADVEYFCPEAGAMVRRVMAVKPGRGKIAAVGEELFWKDVSCEFVER